ncbi:UDP-glucuronosyltransferase-like [Diadema antillarum]|uniref:UDP-glucuronosyltransferase-like n=1 Tax=Diadema antillarum TaxID=105358 RepID=UPI003A8BD43E
MIGRIGESCLISLVVCMQMAAALSHKQNSISGAAEKPASILVSMSDPTSTRSRSEQMTAIARALGSRGHSITYLIPANKDPSSLGVRDSDVRDSGKVVTYDVVFQQADIDRLKVSYVSSSVGVRAAGNLSLADQISRPINPLLIFNQYLDFFVKSCDGIFRDSETLGRLERTKFDLLLHDAFNPCDFLIGTHLGIPYVTMTTSIRFYYVNEATYAIPAPSSYVPFDFGRSFTDEMTFKQRLVNFLSWNVVRPILTSYAFSSFDIIRRKHNVSVGLSWTQMASSSLLWLANRDATLDFAKPLAPNVVQIGGLLRESSKLLSQDLNEFIQGAGNHGVIVFSLGSMVTSLMREDLNELFAEVFSDLPQRVIWRFVGPPPRKLGNNTRLMEWLPQNDLLGHPQTRLLIYHGGINGVYEAIYHKVPMVLLPIFADQPAIGARVSKKGMGVVLDRATLTYATVKGAIEEVIHDPKYKANVEHYGAIHHHSLASPLDTAVFWIEHVLKFGGSHLRLRGSDLSFIVLNSVDVVAFVIIVMVVAIYIDYLVLRTCCRLCCSRKKSKLKAE